MSSNRPINLPSLKIPSEPPKFVFKRLSEKKATPTPDKSEAGGSGQDLSDNGSVDQETVGPDCLPPLVGNLSGVSSTGTRGANLCGGITVKGLQEPRPYKHLAYGTNNWVQLLVAGQLPPSMLENFLNRYINFCQTKTRNVQSVDPEKGGKYKPMRKRDVQLWEPKKVPQQGNSHIDKNLLEARQRQKEQISALAEKVDHKTKQRETVLLKKANTMDDRVQSYLTKLEKRTNAAHHLDVEEEMKKRRLRNKAAYWQERHVENMTELNSLRQGLVSILKKQTRMVGKLGKLQTGKPQRKVTVTNPDKKRKA